MSDTSTIYVLRFKSFFFLQISDQLRDIGIPYSSDDRSAPIALRLMVSRSVSKSNGQLEHVSPSVLKVMTINV